MSMFGLLLLFKTKRITSQYHFHVLFIQALFQQVLNGLN